jgi:hypothetical protein
MYWGVSFFDETLREKAQSFPGLIWQHSVLSIVWMDMTIKLSHDERGAMLNASRYIGFMIKNVSKKEAAEYAHLF